MSKLKYKALAYVLELALKVGPNREEFCEVFDLTQRTLGLSDLDIARTFQISRPTVGRWIRGETAPHPVGRKPILEYLLKRVQEEIENGTQEKD